MWVIGTPGDDVLVGSKGDETFTSRSGRDQVWGLAGEDVIYDDGDDVLRDDSDTKDGGPGDDRIFTSSGADQMVGGTGDDYLFGRVETCAVVDGGEGTDALEVYDIAGLLTFDPRPARPAARPACLLAGAPRRTNPLPSTRATTPVSSTPAPMVRTMSPCWTTERVSWPISSPVTTG